MASEGCVLVRVLARLGERWPLLVIQELAEDDKRFGELKRALDGASSKVLTATLVRLEGDGLVERVVLPVRPPQVRYKVTPLGLSLFEAVSGLHEWAEVYGGLLGARSEYEPLRNCSSTRSASPADFGADRRTSASSPEVLRTDWKAPAAR